MPFSTELATFETKLKLLEPILIDLFKQKKPLCLAVENCFFKKGRVVISHPDIPTLDLLETDLDNVEGIGKEISSRLEKEEKGKRIHELQFQIQYWEHQLSPEFTTQKLSQIELWKAELVIVKDGNALAP